MIRFVLFVDGSNLFGALKAMNLEVDDYEGLYAYVYQEAVSLWHEVTIASPVQSAQLRRVYWYVVGTMDDWDLTLPQAQMHLRERFRQDREMRTAWLATAGTRSPGLAPDKLEDAAWVLCFADFRDWYYKKRDVLDKMRRFHQAVRISTDLIDIIECGHWKVNFVQKWVEEKGLDTSLAVDMVALETNYDVGVVLSGDADSIPSIRYLKSRNKHVAAVEFISGSPPESKGRTFSSRLKESADFVLRIYETELLRRGIARRPEVRVTAAPAAV